MRLSPLHLCERSPIWKIDGKVLTLKAPFSDSLGKKFFRITAREGLLISGSKVRVFVRPPNFLNILIVHEATALLP